MSILLSQTAQEKLQKSEFQSQMSLHQLATLLQSVNTKSLESDPSIRRVRGATEEIYVMRINDLRLFFAKKDNDVVLLSIENG